MAGDWIKMRGSLFRNPKVMAIANSLAESDSFRRWSTDPGCLKCGEQNRNVTRNVTVCVTVCALMQIWCVANECGRADGDDVLLDHTSLETLSGICGVDGFASQVARVGWLVEESSVTGVRSVRFPKFLLYNVPEDERYKKSNAERQRKFREKQAGKPSRQGNKRGNVTRNVTRNVTVTDREEKRREEENTPKTPFEASAFEQSFKEFWDVFPQNRDGKKPEVEECRIKFAHIPPHQWPDVIQAAKHYAASSCGVDGFVMKPAKFIFSGWSDWTEPAREVGGNKVASRAELEEMNRLNQENNNRHRRAKA